jgi:hypothetical protein
MRDEIAPDHDVAALLGGARVGSMPSTRWRM